MADLSRYFDYNATTPMSPAAIDVWKEANEQLWHNPSSLYREAGYARQRLEDAREEVADRLGIEDPERVVFTSGATEANNAIIRHFAEERPGKLVLSSIEHPCVEAAAAEFFGSGRCREIPIDPDTGVIDLPVLKGFLKGERPGAVSLMAANNETGVLQPWSEAAALCREHEVPFHCDAAQWIGKQPVTGLGECDWLIGSGHKFGGGKGAGFLILPKEDAEAFYVAVGGPQEEGRRAGTENLPAILAMVAAMEEVAEFEADAGLVSGREQFEDRIRNELGVRVLGETGPRLWNTSMVLLPYGKNLKWLTRLSGLGFAVSTGSACSAGKGNPSRVMAAMGLDFDEMARVLRFSGGWKTTGKDWNALADSLIEIAKQLKD